MVSFQIPAGPMNLQPLFPGVNFDNVQEYYIQLRDQADDSVIFTTNTFTRSCCCNDDTIRIFFVNYLGGVDAINLKRVLEELETSSQQWKKPLSYPLAKWDGGRQRFNVNSNEVITGENYCFGEEDQDWLKELLGTPNAWIQWIGTQDQDNDYLPVTIEDGKFITRKVDGRYQYVLQLQMRMSNENIILRN